MFSQKVPLCDTYSTPLFIYSISLFGPLPVIHKAFTLTKGRRVYEEHMLTITDI